MSTEKLGPESSRRRHIVEAGIAAGGLLALGAALYNVQRRRASRPETLLDSRALSYKDGAILKSAAAILGGSDVMAHDEIMQRTGLKRHDLSTSLAFMEEQGLVVSAMMASNRKQKHYIANADYFRAVLADPEAYKPIIEQTKLYYADFDTSQLEVRVLRYELPSDNS